MGSDRADAPSGIGMDLRVLCRQEKAGHVFERGQGGTTMSGGVSQMLQLENETAGFTIQHVCFCRLALLDARWLSIVHV